MIPVLSCMQFAANISGTGSGEEKSCPNEGSVTDLTEAEGTGELNGPNSTDLVEQTDAQNNNHEKGTEELSVLDVQTKLETKPGEGSSVDDDAEVDKNDSLGEKNGSTEEIVSNASLIVGDTCDTVVELDDNTSVEQVVNITENNGKCNDTKEEQQNVIEDDKAILTEAPKVTENNKENIVKEEVIKPKKTHVSALLSKSYFDEDSILKFGSVDFADDANIQLEILHEKTEGKSWDDELKETIEASKDLTAEDDIDTNDIDDNQLKEKTINEADLISNQPTIEGDVSIEVVEKDTKADGHAEEKLNQACLLEESFHSNDRVDEERTEIEIESTLIKETSVQEYSANLSGVKDIDRIGLGQCELSGTTEFKETTDKPDGINKTTDKQEGFKETIDEIDISVDEDSKCESNTYTGNSEYDADTSDSETEEIERTNKVKAALLSCLKGKRETFEKSDLDNTNSESSTTEQFPSVRQETFYTCTSNKTESGTFSEEDINEKSKSEVLVEGTSEVESVKQSKNTLIMLETRDSIDGCVSPSMMFASCRYRWERTILTQSPSVVFVTLNNKEIEPIKLVWSESSRCFYSEEIKVPVGVYVGNLVIDGTFYPVEDIVVKHYTFEVDIYLKDDILEDEGERSGVAKAEQFIKQKQQTNSQEPEKPHHSSQEPEKPYHRRDYTYTPDRASGYTYSSTRAKMEEKPVEQSQSEGGINVTSKYEELLRSQMNQNIGALNDNDLDSGMPSKSDYSDLGGRHTPVGEDGDKQYQDGDNASPKPFDRGDNLENTTNSQNVSKYNTTIDDFFEKRSSHSNSSSIQNGLDALERKTPPAVIDDVLGNGHARTPVYSTESPVYSKHSSAHSSARQTPTTTGALEHGRPESVGSTHSANSMSKHLLDELVSDALGRPRAERSSPASEQRDGSRTASTPTRPESVGSAHSENSLSRRAITDLIEDSLNVTRTPPPSRESSVHGSRPQTPPPQEQIDDVLNPADRHSPIRREFLAGSPNLSNHSAKSSRSNQSSAHSSAHSSQRQTPQREIISNSLRASQEKLYSSLGGSGSNTSSRPQSLTSEQELTQYYENLAENKSGTNTDILGTTGPRTGSAASLPAIGSQQRYTPDKRSMTPDNHIRVPVVGSVNKPSLLPSRTPPRTPISNASSRTVTPMNAETDDELRLREQVKDLENTVSNLRTMLTSRETEVLELKDQFSEVRMINEKLQGDLDRHRARASPGPQIAELERKVRDACDERDSLNVEILRLKEELKNKNEPGLNSYDPNSSAALQRKIGELNSQIQDLHEAHEAASEEIHAAERKVKELAGENEKLRITHSERVREIEDENRHLKSEVQRLREGQSGHSDATDYRLKIELQQVKEDNRNLRERNYQLHDDNMRSKEELSELRRAIEFMDKKVQKKDERAVRQLDAYERSATENERMMKSSYHSDLSYTRLSDPVPERRTDRERESYTLPRSNYDLKRTEPLRDDRDYKEERFSKSESTRYESYRPGPDGGSSDKLLGSLGYSRPLTPERPSALGPPKRESPLVSKSQERVDLAPRTFDRSDLAPRTFERSDLAPRTFDRSDLDLSRACRERSRTTSAEIDLRSTPLAAYHGDLSKTTPSLTGRSRAIYQEISDMRSKSKSQSEGADNVNYCESGENESTYNPKTENANNPSICSNQSHTSQVFTNRFVPQNATPEADGADTDTRRLQLAEKIDPAYARREAKVTQQREALEKQMELLEKQAEKQALLSSLPIVTKSGYCDDGNMSDTPTDILVNIQPVDKIPAASWSKGHQRRGSVGSDASNSSFSDIDEQITASVRKRSKSADGREILRRMGPSGSSKENVTLTRTLSPAPSAGLRSLTLRPIATQHNKSSLSLSSSLNSLTQGLRPFAPRSAQDLQINDVIKFSRQGGKLSQGTIKFIGHLPGRGDIYLGVELDKEDGKHDGVFEGIRYFKCKPSKGVFVAYNKVVMAWTSY